ncbi:MAG: preprotein translocase subunit SecA [bacterium]
MGILTKIFGTKYERPVRHLWPLVEQINSIEEDYQRTLADADVPKKTEEFRERIASGETLDDLLPEAFALVKNACRRLLGTPFQVRGHPAKWDMVPYDVQLIGGIVLHQGKITEMATGEGKTLVATMPLYLSALEGKGCHLVTVNDYLAQRDSEWMGLIYRFLGITVGCVVADMPPDERKKQYTADITYGTNSEFGFDYLRDNMALSMEEVVQRGHHYAIVDEVDSVLIDEARTPLIISGPVSRSTQRFGEMKSPVEHLVRLQRNFVTSSVAEVEKSMESPDELDEYAIGRKLLLCFRGQPKHKRLVRLLGETGTKRLMQRVENDLLRDKKMHELDEELYFSIDEKTHVTDLTEKGREELCKHHGGDPDLFVLPDLPDEFARIEGDAALSPDQKSEAREKVQERYLERSERIQNVSQLLRAYSLYERDVEYVIQDGKVLIVDEFTGRLMQGRRYSDGLHQAIEAKEGVTIERETQTIATITLQNYFRLYRKLAGMTGTAETEEQEFWGIYKLEVVVIPTNDEVRRADYDDVIYRTKREKYNAVIEEIAQLHKERQPILVGTTSVEASEVLSRMLKRQNVPHNVLNAKFHEREAEIVAGAGQPGAVTIATNMAGRGTDIKLGEGVIRWDGEVGDQTQAEGGLHIVGTERHEARRIDRQLRGRSGRQGDPGYSRFYLSLEDDLMRKFGSDRIAAIMDRLGVQEGEVITHHFITRAISNAQKRVEAHNFGIRKHLLEYDDVMNQQRTVVYARRNVALRGEDPEPVVKEMISDSLDFLMEKHAEDGEDAILSSGLQQDLLRVFLLDTVGDSEASSKSGNYLQDYLEERILALYARRQQSLGDELFKQLQRIAILRVIDEKWKEHLYEMDRMKEGVGLRAYGQQDPLIEYKKEGFRLFQAMLDDVNQEALRFIFRAQPIAEEAPPPPVRRPVRAPARASYVHAEATGMAYAHASGERPPFDEATPVGKPQPIRVDKVGRNDPCPCGSGKKYKRCHGLAT